ncbi:MAG: serine/threonine protein kinase, partial [Deltaproteobacteria bacterium]|nr:serine/threonine protein kinase [Deltaproteobacteria bacterium]
MHPSCAKRSLVPLPPRRSQSRRRQARRASGGWADRPAAPDLCADATASPEVEQDPEVGDDARDGSPACSRSARIGGCDESEGQRGPGSEQAANGWGAGQADDGQTARPLARPSAGRPARAGMTEKLGRFSLLRRIGSGGMAEVYLARALSAPGTGELLALKRIRPQLSGDADFVAMLAEEAGLSMQLQHPNIVRTHELGHIAGQYYLCMELVEGIDLYRLMLLLDRINTQIPLTISAYIIQQVCNGLNHAHYFKNDAGKQLGIIHRDVSPMNILLSYQGDVKICDFGIAKASSCAGVTKRGVIKGKYHYLSPEYASGGSIDRRTDVFSAGICLWEAICSRMLYLVDDEHELLDVVRAARIPPPSTFRPAVPLQLERIVLKALSRNVDARYPDCAELARDLTCYLQECNENFARDRLADFLHNTLAKEGDGLGRAGGPEPERLAGPCRRRPDQLTARIELSSAHGSGSDPCTEDRTAGPEQPGGGRDSEEC